MSLVLFLVEVEGGLMSLVPFSVEGPMEDLRSLVWFLVEEPMRLVSFLDELVVVVLANLVWFLVFDERELLVFFLISGSSSSSSNSLCFMVFDSSELLDFFLTIGSSSSSSNSIFLLVFDRRAPLDFFFITGSSSASYPIPSIFLLPRKPLFCDWTSVEAEMHIIEAIKTKTRISTSTFLGLKCRRGGAIWYVLKSMSPVAISSELKIQYLRLPKILQPHQNLDLMKI